MKPLQFAKTSGIVLFPSRSGAIIWATRARLQCSAKLLLKEIQINRDGAGEHEQ